MPMFEYRCGDCGARTEELVLAGDSAQAPICGTCGSHDLSRLLSTFAAQSSGNGPTNKSAGFDAVTACGGGACRMPDVCGAGGFDD